jgi:hypothetical protein
VAEAGTFQAENRRDGPHLQPLILGVQQLPQRLQRDERQIVQRHVERGPLVGGQLSSGGRGDCVHFSTYDF